ncbi:MAG TPA: NifU family protein, partial [Nitrospirales bacterium]|nr:NifU family protein [Nitrospirales bacterium]
AAVESTPLLEKINAVLDEKVRPALAGDGGGLNILGLDGLTLKIHYQGACGSCPSSTAGTMMAIQNVLKKEVDEGIQVVLA